MLSRRNTGATLVLLTILAGQGCVPSQDNPPLSAAFSEADFAGTWSIDMTGYNPSTGRNGTDTGEVSFDSAGNVTKAQGGGLLQTLFSLGKVRFTNSATGEFDARFNAPLLDQVSMGHGTMDLSKHSFVAEFPVNNGVVHGVKK